MQQSLVGFANADGGELYIGIEDGKVVGNRIKGFTKPEDANNLLNVLLTLTKPSVDGIEIEYIDFGKRGLVLHLSIPKSSNVHYTSANECFIRLNASTIEIKGEKILALGYAKGSESYEKKLVNEVNLSDILDSPYLIDYLTRIGSNQTPLSFLRKAYLVKEVDGVLLPIVACVLLFAESPQSILDTRCAIKVYRLQTDKDEYKR